MKVKKKDKPKMYIASCSFGKDSICQILLALENNEPLDRVVFSEVMFDNANGISGEIPEHIEWIYNTAIPKLNSMGVKVDVVRSERDYVQLCNSVYKQSKMGRNGYKYGFQTGGVCKANSKLKLQPIRAYYSKYKRIYDIIEYVGIAINEPKRLKRLEGTNKVSLLAKYRYTEQMAMDKCKEYNLVSPCYTMCSRGGCWFCANAKLSLFIHIRDRHPHLWRGLRELDKIENRCNDAFKYGKTLQEVEKEMDRLEWEQEHQLKLF